jgi:hypothetical protein
VNRSNGPSKNGLARRRTGRKATTPIMLVFLLKKAHGGDITADDPFRATVTERLIALPPNSKGRSHDSPTSYIYVV